MVKEVKLEILKVGFIHSEFMVFLLSSAGKGEEEAGIWTRGMATNGSFKANY